MKEAAARIKINKRVESAGWRFFADANGSANIQLEPSVKLKTQDLDALGENFEKASKSFIDFLLLNEKGFPFIVLEAKAEDKNRLSARSRRANMPGHRTAASLSSRTGICITSGTWNAEIPTSSPPSQGRDIHRENLNRRLPSTLES